MSARLLVLAGKDPSRGAGVDADREAAEHFGVEARLVVTTDTEQDGRRVRSVTPRSPEVWGREARELARAGDVLKTGLLADAAAVREAARVAREGDFAWVVVDPVLAASGGEVFLDEAGIEVLLTELVPLGVVLTPNVPEAARLTGADPLELAADPAARVACAEGLLERGAGAVLLKGGHGHEDPVQDLCLERGQGPVWACHGRVAGGGLHGSGCRFASAVGALLAGGAGLEEASRQAGEWLRERLQASNAP